MHAKTVLLLLATSTVPLAGCASAPVAPAPPPLTYEQKLSVILRLEDRRVLRETPADVAPPVVEPRRRGRAAPPAPPPDDLTVLLVDADARVRRRAALGVGRVGVSDGVDPLVATLADPDPEVRAMAAFALGLIGDTRAVPPLTEALADADARVQGRAAEALGTLGARAAAAAIGALARARADTPPVQGLQPDDLSPRLPPDAEALRLAVYALVRLDAWEPLAAAILGPGGEPRVRWWPAAYAVQRIQDPRAIPALLWFLQHGGNEAAAFAARGLGMLYAAPGQPPPADDRVVPALLGVIQMPEARDARLLAAAVRSLGQTRDERAVKPLLGLLRRDALDDNVRLETAAALGAIGSAEAVPLLIDLTGARWPSLRAEAFTALAAADPESLLFVLSSVDPDPEWRVRAAVAGALVAVDPDLAGPRLVAMLGDADARVVPRVLEALGKVGAPGFEEVLLSHLAHEDPVVRATAAAAIGERQVAGGADALRRAYDAARPEENETARLAILRALARYGRDAAADVLRAALDDPAWPVRVRAAGLLRELGLEAAPERPAPGVWTPADYQQPSIVQPAFSPQAYLDTAKGTIQIELAVLDAPLTVANFVNLVRRGFYDALTFHRVVPNFVVQDGDPRGDGEGGPGHTIRDEINTRPYLRGTVGMALDGPDTGGSQYFITHGPQPHLDGRYTVFGQVVAGHDVVDRIARGDVVERVRVWDGVQWIVATGR